MIKANRGPTYLRVAGSARAGRIEMPAQRHVAKPDSAVLEQLQRWEAPVLSDEEVEVYAKIFLMRPAHELVPFFVWIDATRTRRSV